MQSHLHNSFIDFLVEKEMPYQWIDFDQSIIFLPKISLYVQWMGISNNENKDPMYCQMLTMEYHACGKQLWRIWEDQWITHFDMLSGRLMALCGQYIALFARKAEVRRIDTPTSSAFLEHNHTLADVSARYKYGLFDKDNLVAVACFSNPRNYIREQTTYRSAELVRFATKRHYLIAGGLGKLIKAFTNEVYVDDIVTYADLDFSIGQGYGKIGFVRDKILPPQKFIVDKDFNRIYISHKRVAQGYPLAEETRFFYNGGGQKWILFPILETKI